MIEDISPEEFQERFELDKPYEFAPRYNAAPSQDLPVAVAEGDRHVEVMEWGFVMHWSGATKRIINAKAETASTLPTFQESLLTRRCLVFASGFYEFLHTPDGAIPYYFRLKTREMFGLAGLYNVTHDASGNEIKRFVIITTRPNKVVTRVHTRMGAMLKKEDENKWLNPDIVEPERLLSLLDPYPSEQMEAYTVSPKVNNTRNDSPDLIEPYHFSIA